MKKKILVIGIIATAVIAMIGAVLLAGGEENRRTTVTQQGSDTLLELMTNMAESFHDAQDTVAVDVSGGGSGVGIKSLIEGGTNVAQASRQMKSGEIALAQQNGVQPVEFSIAIDGIAIIVNGENTVVDLTMDQLRGIYNGTFTNWNQVGGEDIVITAYGRQSTSGTYEFFKEAVMNEEDFSATVSPEVGNAAIAIKVQQTKGGIGYVGIGYATQADGAKIVPLKVNASATSFQPTDEAAVYNGDYPLARELYLYTNGIPDGATKQWLEYVLSDVGQAIVSEQGFYKLDPTTLDAMRGKLAA